MDNRPNVLMIITDQQAYDTLSFLGHSDISTPNLDRLAEKGVTFTNAYCTYPLCSPSRSSFFTGRMPSETGVIDNALPIRPEIPNLGQILKEEGYETVHIGKWHLPESDPASIPGFSVVPVGHKNGTGLINDPAVSRSCQGYLLNGRMNPPFFMVASFLEPHGVCSHVSHHRALEKMEIPPEIEKALPDLPENFDAIFNEPDKMALFRKRYREDIGTWTNRRMWQYYLWSYYRMIEMVDAEIGRVLSALEQSAYSGNTIVMFMSDHGESQSAHRLTHKSVLYEEPVKMGLIIYNPFEGGRGVVDNSTLVSGLDIVPTVCSYANVVPPIEPLGVSLKPVVKGKKIDREFVAAETGVDGRMIRTEQYKYISYKNDPFKLMFDMKNDPFETRNLADVPEYEPVKKHHENLLMQWEEKLEYKITL